MAVIKAIIYLLVYPGILFLFVYSTFCEWFDRKLYARLQNRIGPAYTGRSGILQPVADFLKLLFKEDIIPEKADRTIFSSLPVIGLAVVLTAGLYLPLWHIDVANPSFNSFQG
ncbi:MAG: NADH-quinone oxidoreductase subunit H, partial [Candidatus Ratteibacteria bacterium]